ncbi:hypothetical protein [uncultured Methanobrevibacter sp.]|uniref:hypothetical protein n=1 Tax=uncultured Methanobrevibacter sp. TaxID=253161 RepID=UPI0025D23214|nr:hypothetical protein [uncultured Methanobrevibacter sp.]
MPENMENDDNNSQKSNNYEFDNSGFKSKDYEDVDEFNIWDLEQIFKDRVKILQDLNTEFWDAYEESKTAASGRRDDKKERLQPLSVRIKAHTKKFLKEESVLSAREILEIYEDFNNGSEDYINSLKRDEMLLKEELSDIEMKLQNARDFTEKLNDIKEAKQKKNEKIKINIE